jgi:hypothetical protein
MSEIVKLIELPAKDVAITLYRKEKGLDVLINQIKEKLKGVVHDVSTVEGRKAYASDARKIASSKMAIENLGKELSGEYKKIPAEIDKERRRAFDDLEAFQADFRKPLTDWEEAEEARVNALKDRLNHIKALGVFTDDNTADDLRDRIQRVEGTTIGEDWAEYESEATFAKDSTLAGLQQALAKRQKYEDEQAELAKLREEAAIRAQKDREAAIAAQAAEAARQAAEAKAKAEQEAAARREADAREAQEKAEHDRLQAIERQKQAEAQAEQDRLAAIEREQQAVENARLAEIQRQEQEQQRIAEEARRRAEDVAHLSNILGEAKRAFMDIGFPEAIAKDIVKLIAAGKVPNVTISY